MVSDQGITRELSLGEVISKTLELYRRNFVKYFLLFVVVEAVIGVVTALTYNAFPLPATPPPGSTSQQVLSWLPGYLGNLFALIAVIGLVSLLFGTIALGGTIKMASEEIEGRAVDLGGAVRFAATKLLWMWVLGLIVGIIVGLGFILIIPGIILAIMFSLTYPALLIENTGIAGSMSRSRELVGHRWLKTFATFLVLGIIVAVAAVVVSLISAPFGGVSRMVSSVLSAFYLPILPVSITVYFYSNRARTAPVQPAAAPTAMPAPGMKFCPNCGAQLEAAATFCSKCGAKQPA